MPETPSHKACLQCNQNKPINAFGKHRGRICKSECKNCFNRRMRHYRRTPAGKQVEKRCTAKYRATERGQTVFRQTIKRYRTKYPDRNKAQSFLNYRIKMGLIKKPSVCSKCGTTGKIEGHHYLGYAKKYWLDVEWLCKPCHQATHSAFVLIVPPRTLQKLRSFGSILEISS